MVKPVDEEIRAFHGNSLAVQWLGLCSFTAEGPGSIPGQGAKIPHAVQRDQKRKEIRAFQARRQKVFLHCS